MINIDQVSIIIPAYNVREYIDACLSSIADAGGADATLILIDDGSTDSTGEQLRSYQRGRANTFLLHSPNRGQGHARNLALAFCRTPFVLFLDADDLIAPEGLTRLCAAADPDIDIVFSNRAKFSDRTGKRRIHANFDDRHRVPMKEMKKPEKIMAPHGKLYRLGFLREHRIQFCEGMDWEDIPFNYRTNLKARLVSSISDVTYLWRVRAGDNPSTTQKLLTERSLSSRFSQILITEPMHYTPEWKDRFGPQWLEREFGSRLMMHIKAMAVCQDEAAVRAAFDAIRDFALPYRKVIETSLRGWKRDQYRQIFAGDVAAFMKNVEIPVESSLR